MEIMDKITKTLEERINEFGIDKFKSHNYDDIKKEFGNVKYEHTDSNWVRINDWDEEEIQHLILFFENENKFIKIDYVWRSVYEVFRKEVIRYTYHSKSELKKL